MLEPTEEPPQPANYPTVREFIVAWEAFYQSRPPIPAALVERSARLARDSFWAVGMQLRRIRANEPEDAEWLFRAWADYEFLIAALWRLRLAALIATNVAQTKAEMETAIAAFDHALPDLARMRHVSQHLNDYAVDHPTERRQRKPPDDELVSRRDLETGQFGEDSFQWLGGSLEASDVESAAVALYSAVRAARDRVLEATADS